LLLIAVMLLLIAKDRKRKQFIKAQLEERKNVDAVRDVSGYITGLRDGTFTAATTKADVKKAMKEEKAKKKEAKEKGSHDYIGMSTSQIIDLLNGSELKSDNSVIKNGTKIATLTGRTLVDRAGKVIATSRGSEFIDKANAVVGRVDGGKIVKP